ncbi:TPA: hypothetical protein EYP44_03180 [Candidatus Bathyarchaeota archaeon]|nr:hypothetical protein [Candidatus Bathyarchaeota archaeon]
MANKSGAVKRVEAAEADDLEKRVALLRRRLAAISAEMADVRGRIASLRQRRDEYNRRAREISSKIREVRARRGLVISEIRTLARTRRDVITQMRALRERVNEARRALPSGFDPGRLYRLRDELEWRIQTEGLPLDEEKRLVAEVKRISLKLAGFEELKSLRGKIEELRGQVDKIGKDVTERRGTVKALGVEIARLVKEREEIRKVADSYHEKVVEAIRRLKGLEDELKEVNEELASLLSKLMEARRAREKDIRRRKVKEIKEKLRKGQRVTIEELALLEGLSDLPL